MRMTKILWLAVPVVFVVALLAVFLGPSPSRTPEIRLRQIAITADKSDPEDVERVRRQIEEICKELDEGADFTKLAEAESDAPNLDFAGDMGWQGRGSLPERFEDIAFNLEVGQHSEVIIDGSGGSLVYRIFYVEGRRN